MPVATGRRRSCARILGEPNCAKRRFAGSSICEPHRAPGRLDRKPLDQVRHAESHELYQSLWNRLSEIEASWTAQHTTLYHGLVQLLAGWADDATRARMAAWIREGHVDLPKTVSLASAILSTAQEAHQHHLEVLVEHVAPGDPLLPLGACAMALRDGTGAIPVLAEVLTRTSSDERRVTRERLANFEHVNLDAEPEWVEVLGLGGTAHCVLYSETTPRELKTAEPILRALELPLPEAEEPDRASREEAWWADLLNKLKRLDDPRSALRLETLAKTLPKTEKGQPKRHRSSNAVMTLVKRLRRKRDKVEQASFEFTSSISGDGGPALVVSRDAAVHWKGADEDGAGDYERACEASEQGEVAKLVIGDRQSLVFGELEDGIRVAHLTETETLLAWLGTDLMIEMAMRERGAWKKAKPVLEVGETGAVLLDAGGKLDAAKPDGVADLPLVPGTYAVHELRTDGVYALKLSPTKPKAKKAPGKKQAGSGKHGA